MIRGKITHPELLQALAEAGHGARILVADGNYPVTVKANQAARIVYLNFTPGMVSGTDIITALAKTVVVESAIYMAPSDKSEPTIVKEYRSIIGADVPFCGKDRFGFYDEALSDDVSLVIASGERRAFANLLLTVGALA